MIPEGWREAKIREVAKIDVGRDLVEERFARTISDTHRFPIYSNTVEQHGHYGFYDFPEYSVESVTVVGRGIGLGTAFARTTPFGAIGRLLVLSPKHDSFDVGYLADYLNHGFQIHYESGGIPQLPGKTLGNYSILLPPLPEQRRIAEILATWDRAIETVEALIANARAQKKALMQSLLTGKHRLPGFSGEWVSTTLGELGQISSAGVDKKLVEGEAKVRLLNFLDVYNREFIHDSDLKQVVTAPAAKVRQCGVRAGDVFFTPSSETRNDIALSAVAAEVMPGVAYSYHVVRFRPAQTLDLTFSAYLFQTDRFRMQAARLGDGSGQRYVISQPNFRRMEVQVPPMAEQSAIGAILRNQSQTVEALQSQLTALRQEKSALMQQLLTGKRRVKLADSEAA